MRDEARFLLHVWRDGDADDAWRARLEALASREVRLFASLEELHRHLADELASRTGPRTPAPKEDT